MNKRCRNGASSVLQRKNFRPGNFYTELECLAKAIGNPEKARRVLGWDQKVDFTQLIEMMVDADLERLSSRESALAANR